MDYDYLPLKQYISTLDCISRTHHLHTLKSLRILILSTVLLYLLIYDSIVSIRKKADQLYNILQKSRV